jgi:MFS family permease
MTATDTAAQSSRPAVNPWVVLAFICIPVFIGSIDLTIVSAFLPEVIIDLELPIQTTLDDAAWILSGYLLAYTVGLTFMGRVSDLLGRRMVYVICLLVFIAGSILVATSHLGPADWLYTIYRRLGQRPDIAYVRLQSLIIGRIIQALGAGALVPVSLALVGDLFPPERRAQPLGLIGAVDTLGWVLGHLYGGVMVEFFGRNAQGFKDLFAQLGINLPPPTWHTLFWLNVPFTIIALVFTLWALRNVPQRRAKGRFDFIGLVLIVGAVIALNVGLGANVEVSNTAANFEDMSALPAYALPLVGVAVILVLGFVLVERRVRDPLIDLNLFRKRHISAGLLTNLAVGYCLFIGLVIVPILVNVRLESTAQLREAALQVGILLSALTIPMALAAVPGGWLADRIGYQRTTMIGLGLAIVGFLLIWQTWHLEVADALIAGEMLLVGVGLGLTFSPISVAVINAADDDQRGVASAMVIIVRLVGMTLSVSSLTTLALQRVTGLAAIHFGNVGVDPYQYADTYARITVQVLGELGLLGALLCGLALIPAYYLRHQKTQPTGGD